MADCLFCRIIAGEIPSTKVFEDELVVAFKDITPQAPLHVLVVPRKHIATLNDVAPGDEALLGRMTRCGAEIAKQHGYDASGFRTVFNCNRDAGQAVFHIHLHVLAGRSMSWPPG
jgi:histidine triad (HIT) family protein